MLSQEEKQNLFKLLQSNDVDSIALALQIGAGTNTRLYLNEFEKLWVFLQKVKCAQIPPSELSIAEKIWELMQIETLTLRLEESEIIPDGIYFMKNLQNLTIEAYGEVYFPKTITWVDSIVSLTIHLLNTDKLPEEIFEMPQLEELNLTFSMIQEIPEAIFNLQSLHTLNLTYCLHLTQLPYEVFSLPLLYHLYIAFTAIEEISSSIGFSHLKNFSFDSQVDPSLFTNFIFGQKMLKFSGEPDTLFGKAFQEHLRLRPSQKIRNIPESVKKAGLEAIKNHFRYQS